MEQQKMIGFLLYGGGLLWFGLYLEQKPYMKKLQSSYKVGMSSLESIDINGFLGKATIEWE
jgi:hypothetical protein